MPMGQAMFAKLLPASLIAVSACAPADQIPASIGGERELHSSEIVRFSQECEKWDEWDKPAKPFRIHADTYYVGTCGIAAILIVNDEGHILIDTGTEKGADVVLANIAALGFDPADIGLLLASHEHFDHVGGMAKVQQVTGGLVVSSEIAIEVMLSGEDHPDDPQFGVHEPMRPIAHGVPYNDGIGRDVLSAFEITALTTPGHTPGAMTWSWQSCDGDVCQTIVYADSLSPVSGDDYKFSDHQTDVALFIEGLESLVALDCDILLTPHPSHSRMVERAAMGTFLGGMSCAEYANGKMRDLDARLEREAGAGQ